MSCKMLCLYLIEAPTEYFDDSWTRHIFPLSFLEMMITAIDSYKVVLSLLPSE